MIVSKFGGSSMAYPEVVTKIIESDKDEGRIIVCSAPGKSVSEKTKATDLLLDLLKTKNRDRQIERILERFEKIVIDLPSDFKKEFLEKIRKDLTKNNDPNFLISRGEYYSAWALSYRLNTKFIDAVKVFRFDNDGTFNREASSKKIQEKLAGSRRAVIPGFYGADEDGNIHLFGRGGSDRSGAIIAASLNADYENWTDVDGILSGDPEAVKNPKVLSELTYEEVREGAHGGAGVLMGDSILDLEYGKGDVILKNTFNPSAPGTRIKKSRSFDGSKPVIALSARDDLLALTIHDLGMRDSKVYLAKILDILGQNNISIEHMPTAQDSITITFHNDD
ncbi:aspartate kinase, partial [Candidatus Saccharibacteria bacterium]|nr:aspartate kinase [Candidatus Saccharibacteria bacterium]